MNIKIRHEIANPNTQTKTHIHKTEQTKTTLVFCNFKEKKETSTQKRKKGYLSNSLEKLEPTVDMKSQKL